MNKVYIRTYAYNAEKTLRRAVDSIRNQTHQDWVYFLCNNGSTDKTSQIVDEFAEKDKRIKAFHNKINRNYNETPEVLNIAYNIDPDDFFCILDADDEYSPTFIEEMLLFIEKNDLDIAACGSNFFDVSNKNKLFGKRALQEDLIISNSGFDHYFRYYHQFMRTRWAKLFRGKVLKNIIEDPKRDPNYPGLYGGDTYNVFLSLQDSERVGISAKILHNYYVNNSKSISYKWNMSRVESDKILYNQAYQFLVKKCGMVSTYNDEFLMIVYMNALVDTFKILMNSNLNASQIVDAICRMFLCNQSRNLASRNHFGALIGNEYYYTEYRQKLFSKVAEVLLKIEEVPDEQVEQFCELGEFVSAAANFNDGWIQFNKLRILFLIQQGRKQEAIEYTDEFETLIPNDPTISYFRSIL